MPCDHEVDARRRIAISGALAALGGLNLLPFRAAPAASRALAPPERTGGMALDRALALRRSVRSYAAQPLALAAVSQPLWAAQGTTNARGQRTAPSVGASYPLELHLLAERVAGYRAACPPDTCR